MPDGLTIAYSGALAQSQALEAAANNLANASTHGYRAQRPVFAQILNQPPPVGGDGVAVRVGEMHIDLSPGPVEETGGPLDVALRGPGFLAVTTPQGERFTRTGNLAISGNGTLVTAAGQTVQSESGEPLRLDPSTGEIAIAHDGTLQVGGATIGRLRIVEFSDPSRLAPEGDGMLRAPSEAGARPASATDVLQGHLERSNVNVVRGLTELVRISRAHDAFFRTIHTLRDIDRRAANDVGAKR